MHRMGAFRANLVDGAFQVQHRPGAASFLEAPLARPRALRICAICR